MFFVTGHVVSHPYGATSVGLCNPASQYKLAPAHADGQWRVVQVPSTTTYKAFTQSVRVVASRDFPGKKAQIRRERPQGSYRYDNLAYIRLEDKRDRPTWTIHF